jgi:nucleoside 2-deoxyribosyltransferase
MKIYLACTVRGDRSAVAAARRVGAGLAAAGHEVLTAHLLDDDVERAEGRLADVEVFERDLAWLNACDVLVAEASGSSFGVGFEVGYVLSRAAASGQHVLLLYDAARRPSVSRMITGNTHPACRVFAYQSQEDLERFVAASLP